MAEEGDLERSEHRMMLDSNSSDHVTNIAPQHVDVTTNRKEQCYITGTRERQVIGKLVFNSKDAAYERTGKPYERKLSGVRYVREPYVRLSVELFGESKLQRSESAQISFANKSENDLISHSLLC